MIDIGSEGNITMVYTEEEAASLNGKLVKCNMADCDGTMCEQFHKKPHEYDDEECFQQCGWPGKTGMCVETTL
jgi:hypothetical protein